MQRLREIRSEVDGGARIVEISSLPGDYERFVHDITLYKENELNGYKEFYGLPDELILRVS